MDRLEELDVLIGAQQAKVDKIGEQVSEVTKQANEECRQYLLDLLEQVLEGQEVDLRLSISDLGGHGSVELKDEKGKNIFGSGFEIYLNSRSWTNDGSANVQFNIGTCGAFGKDNKAQIKKYGMFAKCLVAIEQVEAYFLERYYRIVEANKPYRDEDAKLQKLISEKETIEDKILNSQILESIVVGNIYRNTARWSQRHEWKRNTYCRVSEIKNKTIEIEVGTLDNNNFECRDFCRVKKDELIWGLKNNRYEKVSIGD